MNGKAIGLSLLVTLAAAAQVDLPSANAAPRYYPSTWASPVYRKTFMMFGAGTHTFSTADLKTPLGGLCPTAPDTFLIVRTPTGASFTNDNCTPYAKESCVTATSSVGGVWTATVIASVPTGCGTMDLKLNGVTKSNDAGFGGAVISLSSSLPTRSYVFNTAHLPGSATDTWLIHYSSTWQEKGTDDDGGAGKSARLWSSKASGDKLVVGTWNWSNYGPVNVLINECQYTPDFPLSLADDCYVAGLDPDKDNLATFLENEMGTSSVAGSGHDTDHDGLYDSYEVLGRWFPDGGGEEELTARGSSPLRRDIFLEIDYRDNWTMPPLSFAAAASMEQRLADAPGWPPLPGVTQGVALHVDTGPPVQGSACVGSTLCGDWGGSGFHPYDTTGATIGMSFVRANLMAPVRLGTYQYGYFGRPTAAKCGVGGSSKPKQPTFWHCTGGTEANTNRVLHELGHSLGLDHHGDIDLPGQLDQKLNYRSVMNYAYMDGDGGIGSLPGFSSGSWAPIDNLALDEVSWSPGFDKEPLRYVRDYSQDGNQRLVPVVCTSPCGDDSIDWNLDGLITAGGVQFDVSPGGGTPGRPTPGGDWEGNFGFSPVTAGAGAPNGGIALAPVGNELFAFGRVDGHLRYTRTNLPTGGWSSWSLLGETFSLGVGDAAAASFQVQGSPRVLVVHPGTAGALHFVLFDPAAGNVVAEGPIPSWPAGSVARQVSMAAIGTSKVAIAFRDLAGPGSVNTVWYSRVDDSMNFTTWAQLTLNGSPLVTSATPAVIVGPDDKEYVIYRAVGSSSLGVTSRWASAATGDFSGQHLIMEDGNPDNAPLPDGRINGVFAPYLTGAGLPFTDGSGYLAIYANRGVDTFARAYVGPVGPAAAGFATNYTVWRGLENPPNSRIHGAHALGLTRVGSRIVLAYSRESAQPGGGWLLDGVEQLGYANGLAPRATKHTDFTDAPKMHASMCESLWSIVPCGQRCTNPLWSGTCSETEVEPIVCNGMQE